MHLNIILKGFLIGLLASIPLGPIGVLCIQRTLSKKFRSGFLSGLGAASADTLFALGAMFSLSLVMSFVENNMNLLKVVGGICIVILGITIYYKNPIVQIRRNRARQSNLWKDYLSVFFLTLTNPSYILVFVALFATFGVSEMQLSLFTKLTLILGVLTGAATWWFLLTFSLNLVRSRFKPRHLFWINRIAGAAIVVLGAVAILSIFIHTPVGGAGQILPKP